MQSMPRLVSLAVMVVLIAVLGGMFYQVLAPFILPLFLAGMTAVVCQPVYRYFLSRMKDKVSWAAGATTATIMAALMVPLFVGIIVASLQLYTFALTISDNNQWQKTFGSAEAKSESVFAKAVEFGNQFLPREKQHDPEVVAHDLALRIRGALFELGDRSLGRAAGTTLGILSETASWLIAACIALVIYGLAVYYFLADGPALLSSAEKLIPVHQKYQHQLVEQFAKVVRSVVLATFLAALGQGLATTVALWFFGFPHLFVLAILSTVSAMIPVAGTWLVWLPCALVLYSGGHWIQGTLLVIYGAAFVGILDNIIRTYVLNTDTKLHPLLAFVSIIGGIQVMGLWGVFIGPTIASCLHALIKIFNHELQELSKEHFQKRIVLPKELEETKPALQQEERASEKASVVESETEAEAPTPSDKA